MGTVMLARLGSVVDGHVPVQDVLLFLAVLVW